jgi:hypothetical protein
MNLGLSTSIGCTDEAKRFSNNKGVSMSNSNNGSKVSKLNNGVLSMKTKLVINDLSYYSEEFAPGNSFGEQLSKSSLYANFADQVDEEDAAEISCMETDQAAWFEYLETQNDPAEKLLKARSILNTNRYYTSDMSDELAVLLFEQSEEESSDNVQIKFVDKSSELVTVTLQKYGKGPFPYTLKETNKYKDETLNTIQACLNPEGKVKFMFSPESIFDMEDGQIVGLKMVENGTVICRETNKEVPDLIPAITLELRRLGYGWIVGGVGRIVMSSSLFTCFAKLEHVTLNRNNKLETHSSLTEVPASFRTGYNKATKQVESVFCDYAWANPVEIADGIFVLPASADTDIARMDEVTHDQEIMYGKAMVTNAMVHADIFDAVRKEEANAERNEAIRFAKAQVKAEAVKSIKAAKSMAKAVKHMEVCLSDIGQLAERMIQESYINSAKVIQLGKDNAKDLPAIMSAMFEIRKATGNGCQYDVFKKLEEISELNFSEEIKAIVQTIRELNKGFKNKDLSARVLKTIDDYSDEQVVSVLKVAESQSTKLDYKLWLVMNARKAKIQTKANIQAAKKLA